MAARTPHNRRRLWLEALENRTLLASGVGVFSPATATWALRSTASPGEADVGTFQYGINIPAGRHPAGRRRLEWRRAGRDRRIQPG